VIEDVPAGTYQRSLASEYLRREPPSARIAVSTDITRWNANIRVCLPTTTRSHAGTIRRDTDELPPATRSFWMIGTLIVVQVLTAVFSYGLVRSTWSSRQARTDDDDVGLMRQLNVLPSASATSSTNWNVAVKIVSVSRPRKPATACRAPICTRSGTALPRGPTITNRHHE